MAARPVAAGLLALVLLAGCGGGSAPARPAPKPKAALTLALMPDARRAADPGATAAIAAFLSAHAGTPVSLQVPASYGDVLDGLQEGTLDGAWMESLAYLALKPRARLAVATQTAECLPTYTASPPPAGCKPQPGRQSIIVCSTGVTINELTDGRDWSSLKGKSFLFGDPASPGASLWPRYYMRRNHVDPTQDLSRAASALAPAAEILAVYNGEADCGAFTDDPRPAVRNLAPDIFDRTRVVFVAPQPLPGDPQVISAGLNPQQAQALKKALLELGRDPSMTASLTALYGVQGLSPATDADYGLLRQVVADVSPGLPATLLPSPSPSPAASR